MKKVIVPALAAIMAAGMCMSASAQTEVIVFAAASMTETLTQIKDLYEEANPDFTLTYNFT